MTQHNSKKNEQGGLGTAPALLFSLGQLRTNETTSIDSRLFCQVRFLRYDQADLFDYRVLVLDVFGLHQAGHWYD